MCFVSVNYVMRLNTLLARFYRKPARRQQCTVGAYIVRPYVSSTREASTLRFVGRDDPGAPFAEINFWKSCPLSGNLPPFSHYKLREDKPPSYAGTKASRCPIRYRISAAGLTKGCCSAPWQQNKRGFTHSPPIRPDLPADNGECHRPHPNSPM